MLIITRGNSLYEMLTLANGDVVVNLYKCDSNDIMAYERTIKINANELLIHP